MLLESCVDISSADGTSDIRHFLHVTIAVIKQALGNETTDICHWKHFHITCMYRGTSPHCASLPTRTIPGTLSVVSLSWLVDGLVDEALDGWRQWHAEGGFGVFNPTSPEIPKALQNRAKLNLIVKTVKNSEFRTPTPQDVRKKGSKILKLPTFAIVLH